ncbi:MAG: hypothetical protein NT027_16035 [Proteobacteria bacterium]|nr:hypothetical protein [Pseudomonadota bacterium]
MIKSLSCIISIALLSTCSETDLAGGGQASKKDKKKNADNSNSTPKSEIENEANIITSDDGCIKRVTPKQKTEKFGNRYVHNVFYQNVAVDPGNTNNHVLTAGYKAYPISPKESLSDQVIPVSMKVLAEQGPNAELELFGFSHQFQNGLDTCNISFKSKDANLSAVNTPNIYSSYCYLFIKNVKKDGDRYIGDVSLDSVSFQRRSSDPLLARIERADPSAGGGQDATNLLKTSISSDVKPKFTKQNVDLTDLEIKVKLGADSYDSVQYRALKAQIWSDKPDEIKDCQ